jgi:hypothetical protein
MLAGEALGVIGWQLVSTLFLAHGNKNRRNLPAMSAKTGAVPAILLQIVQLPLLLETGQKEVWKQQVAMLAPTQLKNI